MAIGLEHVRHRTGSIVHDVGALMIAGADRLSPSCSACGSPTIRCSPASRSAAPFFNLILLGYGIPAVLAIVLALQTRDVRPQAYRIVAAAIAVLLMLSYLSLEVRTLYHGPVLSARRHHATPSNTPIRWCGSPTAWRCCCSASRSARSRRGSRPLRSRCSRSARCSWSTWPACTGVFRALSFIGLGLVLVGIGWLYQRLLFPPRPKRKRRPV